MTGLAEIRQLAEILSGYKASKDQVKRALKALHDAKFIHKTHGRGGDLRGILYIRLMGGSMVAALCGSVHRTHHESTFHHWWNHFR